MKRHEQNKLIASGSRSEKATDIANNLIFGFAIGSQFFLTSFASILTIFPNRSIAIPLGVMCGMTEAITNGTLSPTVTRQLFTQAPRLWLSTFLVYISIGGTATLPMVEGVQQALDVIAEQTGIDANSELCKEIFGNMTLLTYGIFLSMGFSRLIYNTGSLIAWKVCRQKKQRFAQMRNYLHDQRSLDEYTDFIQNPENFLTQKYSNQNKVFTLLSLLSLGYAYGVGPEIAEALEGQNKPFLANLIDFFGHNPLDELAMNKTGAIIVSCMIGGPLYSGLVATTLRTIYRDGKYIVSTPSHGNIANSLIMFSYFLFNMLSLATAFLMSSKAGDPAWIISLTIVSAFLINYSGARDHYVSLLSGIKNKLTCKDVSSDIESIPLIHHPSSELPVKNEQRARDQALEVLSAEEANFVGDNSNSFFKCCRRKVSVEDMIPASDAMIINIGSR